MPDTVIDVPADTLPPGTAALGAGERGAGSLDKGQRRCWTEASQQDFYLQL